MNVNVNGDEYQVMSRRVTTGCGPRFDGRVKYTLKRLEDGAIFQWLGGRGCKRVASNARLSEHEFHSYYVNGQCVDCGAPQ